MTAAATVVAAAAVFAAVWSLRNNSNPAGPVARAAPPIATRTSAPARAAPRPPASSTTTRKPRPRPRPKPRPKPLRLFHEYVAATAPYGFLYRGPGFTVWAHVCGMDYVRPLDPPGEQHHTVCWVQHDFGYPPGSRARGTTYVLGHAWAEDPLEVLNPVSSRVTAQMLRQHRTSRLNGIQIHPVTVLNGDVIILRTDTGELRYTVRSAYAVNKSRSGEINSLMDQHTPNRLVLITCAELGGVDYDYNVIVNAYLTASRAYRT